MTVRRCFRDGGAAAMACNIRSDQPSCMLISTGLRMEAYVNQGAFARYGKCKALPLTTGPESHL